MDSKTFHKELVKRINEAILKNKIIYNARVGGKGITYGTMLGLRHAITIADALAQEAERK